MTFRAMDSDNPHPPPKTEGEEDEYETPTTVTVHCDYGECDAVISDYGGRKEVSFCPKGTGCDKFVWCPFTFDK